MDDCRSLHMPFSGPMNISLQSAISSHQSSGDLDQIQQELAAVLQNANGSKIQRVGSRESEREDPTIVAHASGGHVKEGEGDGRINTSYGVAGMINTSCSMAPVDTSTMSNGKNLNIATNNGMQEPLIAPQMVAGGGGVDGNLAGIYTSTLNTKESNSRSSSATSGTATLAAALQYNGSEGTSPSSHPNIFVRGLPLTWSEPEITTVFQQFGNLTSLRLVRHSVTKQSLGYGFVRFKEVSEARAAINALDGTTILGQTLQVKFADADAGPPSSGSSSGLTPSDSCYVKHLPAQYSPNEVKQLFEPYGTIMDVKLFPCLDQFRGASGLVRMGSIEMADRAIQMLNGATPPGGTQTLIVRFAESPTEKAARLSRKEKQQQGLQRTDVQSLSGNLGTLDASQLQHALSALSLQSINMPNHHINSGLSNLKPIANSAMLPTYQPAIMSSICVKGLPPNTDRLWIYENFAKFGALTAMKIIIEEENGMCTRTAFINYADTLAAERAKQAIHGMRFGDQVLQVLIQEQGKNGSNNIGLIPSVLGGNEIIANGISTDVSPGILPGSMQTEWQQLLQQQKLLQQHNQGPNQMSW